MTSAMRGGGYCVTASARAVIWSGAPGRSPDTARDLQEPQGVAADEDLVAVGQRRPLDALAVDEDAVQRAVVEHADAVRAAHEQGVAARDGGVVEADVGGQGAADAGPLAGERDDPDRSPSS